VTKLIVYITNRLWLISIIYLASLTIASLIFSIVEAKSFGDSLWWSISTSLSIGYGDVVPRATIGRISGAVFAHFWIFTIIPLIAANIIMRVIEDKHRFTDDEQSVLFGRIERMEKHLEHMINQSQK
jgi:voltage-gated potassium channel